MSFFSLILFSFLNCYAKCQWKSNSLKKFKTIYKQTKTLKGCKIETINKQTKEKTIERV
jgi:cytochrome oxidase Cu insertion factor (SCO1/SenC/PrrC family)